MSLTPEETSANSADLNKSAEAPQDPAPATFPRMQLLDEIIASGKTILYNGQDFQKHEVVAQFVETHGTLTAASSLMEPLGYTAMAASTRSLWRSRVNCPSLNQI
jgi:hypothetical protein